LLAVLVGDGISYERRNTPPAVPHRMQEVQLFDP
jgi:hypothetical protein